MKFEVGERVAAYNCSKRYVGIIMGNNPSQLATGLLVIKTDSGLGTISFHPKQCRLLKKKGRRRIWLCEKALPRIIEIGFSSWTGDKNKPTHQAINGGDWIEFIQVRGKK